MNDEFVPVVALAGAAYAVYRFYRWQKSLPQRSEDIYWLNVRKSVRTLSAMVDELEQLEEIITDLHTCDSDNLKGITLSVPSFVGKNNEYTILTDGQDFSGESLLSIAYTERERKREQIGQAIGELYSKGIVSTSPLTESETDEQPNQETQTKRKGSDILERG